MYESKKLPLIVVAGATASGKTRLAIDIAKKINGEIVSADSMQIYKYMDIGSAKPTKEEQGEVRHHLIDIIEPDEEFSAADYTQMAHKTISDIISRGRLPVMCGGTGLYINSVVNDIDFGDIKTDYDLRNELNLLAKEKGNEYLLRMLADFDKESAQSLHPNNLKRIVRAIEYYKLTGRTISSHNEETKNAPSRYSPIMFAVEWNREILYDRINKRVDIMLEEGLLDEVRELLAMGFSRDLNSMQAIGYKEFFSYFDGKASLDDTIALIKQNSRRYAKRQLTWFRRDERINRLNADENISEQAFTIIKDKGEQGKCQ